MKVVFLDIDGVLNSHRTVIANGGYPHTTRGHERDMFDDTALKLIRGIVRTAGAQIVLSSTWRKFPDWEEIGPGLDLPIIDRTPSLSGTRGEEIADWLRRHTEVERYAIIDDDSDMLEVQKPFFVHTSHFDGFSWKNAEQLAVLMGIVIYDVNHPKNKPAEPGNAGGWM